MDTILLPAVDAGVIEKGEPDSEEARRFASPLPPPYAGGIEKEGGEKLKKWVEEGGTLVALDESCEYAIRLLDPPVLGSFSGDTGVFEGADTFEGRPILVRFTWAGVTTPTPRWEQAFSEDGGETWETNWIMEFARAEDEQ